MNAIRSPRLIAWRAASSVLISAMIACVGFTGATGQGMAKPSGKDASASMSKAIDGRDPVREFADGVIALQAADFQKAAASLQKASEDSPANPDIWKFLGAARAGLKDWAGSRTAYEAALQLDPGDVGSHAGLGVALAALGDPKAKAEVDWMGERVKTCGGHCPDADYLSAMFAQVQSAAAGQTPQPVL